MVKVYEFPPVGISESEWTTVNPLHQSRSAFNSSRYSSAYERQRRIARMTASSLGTLDGAGAGYMEVLKRLLKTSDDSSQNLVRLYSLPINFARMYDGRSWGGSYLSWTTGGNPLGWTVGGNPLTWFTSTPVGLNTITVDGEFFGVQLTGLPPSVQNLFMPGDFITFYADENDTVGQRLMVVRPSSSASNGTAWVRFMASPPSDPYRIVLWDADVGVFEPVVVPRASQRPNSDWSYAWEFQEVFEDETDGFEYVNPW